MIESGHRSSIENPCIDLWAMRWTLQWTSWDVLLPETQTVKLVEGKSMNVHSNGGNVKSVFNSASLFCKERTQVRVRIEVVLKERILRKNPSAKSKVELKYEWYTRNFNASFSGFIEWQNGRHPCISYHRWRPFQKRSQDAVWGCSVQYCIPQDKFTRVIFSLKEFAWFPSTTTPSPPGPPIVYMAYIHACIWY